MAGSESRIFARDAYPAWLTPFDAVQLLLKAGLDDREHAVNWLAARLKTGELRAIALGFEITEDHKVGDEYHYFTSMRLWRNAHKIPWKHDFWISGTFSPEADMFVEQILPYGTSVLDARFEPDIIVAFADRAIAMHSGKPSAPPNKHPGGRPQKPFWDELWVSISAQLHNGDLQPKRQADIERAMHDWLVFNGNEAGETAVRAKAKLLWAAIQKED